MELAGFLGARQKIGSKFLPVYFPQFVPKHIEKQGVMGRKHGFDSVILSRQKLGQIVADGDGVVFIQRRNRVINIDVFHPLVGVGTIQGELSDGEKEAPDKQVLFAARHLDIVNGRAIDLAGEANQPFVVVNDEVKVRVTLQERPDAIIHFQFVQAGKKTGLGIKSQITLAVAV